MGRALCKCRPSKYKYVQEINPDGDKWYWQIRLPSVTKKTYATEREAAIAVDKWLISKGKKPVNILVAK